MVHSTDSKGNFGQMMDCPMLISTIISSAARHHPQCQIVSKSGEGDIHRYSTQDLQLRAKKLAQSLQILCPLCRSPSIHF